MPITTTLSGMEQAEKEDTWLVPKCDVVYMSHILEHFDPHRIIPILHYIKDHPVKKK